MLIGYKNKKTIRIAIFDKDKFENLFIFLSGTDWNERFFFFSFLFFLLLLWGKRKIT